MKTNSTTVWGPRYENALDLLYKKQQQQKIATSARCRGPPANAAASASGVPCAATAGALCCCWPPCGPGARRQKYIIVSYITMNMIHI